MSDEPTEHEQGHLPSVFREVNFEEGFRAFEAFKTFWNDFETEIRRALRGEVSE